jgi:hypothetical protein
MQGDNMKRNLISIGAATVAAVAGYFVYQRATTPRDRAVSEEKKEEKIE